MKSTASPYDHGGVPLPQTLSSLIKLECYRGSRPLGTHRGGVNRGSGDHDGSILNGMEMGEVIGLGTPLAWSHLLSEVLHWPEEQQAGSEIQSCHMSARLSVD